MDEVEVKAAIGGDRTVVEAKDFVHLHNHTHFSLLDGLTKIEPLVSRIKELGMESVAITDHGTLSGAIEFYKECKKQAIKPIIGIEIYVAGRKHTDKDPQKDKARRHLIILAMNNTGYQNLMKLSTIANLDGFYHKPRIDHDLLEQYNEGLIILSGCIGGEVGDALRNNQYDEAKKIAQWYRSLFGDRYYLELQDHGHSWDEQKRVNDQLLKLSAELHIQAVVTSDAHYLTHEDQEAHEVILCVQTGSLLSDEKRMSLKDTDLFVSDQRELRKRWIDNPELLTNTKAIADRCDVSIELGTIRIPKYEVPESETEKSFLHKMVWRGLAWRFNDLDRTKLDKLSVDKAKSMLSKEVIERANFELEVIGSMGFDGYFLIVQDFINWGKDQGIVFGPGRGSAAGSIVSYSLNITDLDPLKYDLIFERFLNPDRISMPDIDIDIQDSRRDEVIKYCVDKYGQDRVAHIVTYGTMAGRAAIRDVARVLDVPYAEADRLAKLVPPPIQGRHIPLATSAKKDPDFRKEYLHNPGSKRVIDLAVRVEGTIRSHGVHAAGVVIAPDEIVKFTPLEMAQKGVITTQYAMGPVESLGLLKMDFLGLSNLTIVNNALKIIERVYGDKIDISKLPLDDKETFELMGRGDTTGVFQLESGGMKRYLRELKPSVFDDIIAMGALYRPGPLTAGFTQQFIDRKIGLEEVTYEHETMRSALESTYGVLVYQEQVMQLAKDMSGFTGGEADTLRKAVGKKQRAEMAKMRKAVVDGAQSHGGVPKDVAEKFWKDLEGFADYAFPKAHAACYGLISYWTGYLKAHYPAAFMAALMTSDYDNTDRITIEITEARHMGLEVTPPDVNESFVEFAVVPPQSGEKSSKIRYGMAAIKNVGAGAVEEILRVREEKTFQTVADFAERVSTKFVNRKAWESLIKSGAFDSLGTDRGTLLFNIENIVSYASRMQKQAASGQTDLFGEAIEPDIKPQLDLVESNEIIDEHERLKWERELLGIYLSSHPLEDFEDYLYEQTMSINELTPEMDNKKVTIGGLVSSVREISTKKGDKMAFVVLEDATGELEMVVFPSTYSEKPKAWVQDAVIKVTGKINTKDRDGRATQEVKVIVNEVSVVTREDIEAFEKTGEKLEPPKARKAKNQQPLKSVTAADSPKSVSGKQEPAATTKKPPVEKPKRLFVHLTEPDNHDKLLELKQTFNKYPGKTEVIVVIDRDSRQAIKLPDTVEPSEELIRDLGEIYTPEAVALK